MLTSWVGSDSDVLSSPPPGHPSVLHSKTGFSFLFLLNCQPEWISWNTELWLSDHHQIGWLLFFNSVYVTLDRSQLCAGAKGTSHRAGVWMWGLGTS